jgi:hypothetical protein
MIICLTTMAGYLFIFINLLPTIAFEYKNHLEDPRSLSRLISNPVKEIVLPFLALVLQIISVFIYGIVIEYNHGYIPVINSIGMLLLYSVPLGYATSIHQLPEVKNITLNIFSSFIQTLVITFILS